MATDGHLVEAKSSSFAHETGNVNDKEEEADKIDSPVLAIVFLSSGNKLMDTLDW